MDESRRRWERYLREIPSVSLDEEIALIVAAREGDEQAKQRLIQANLRLVVNIAKTFRQAALPFDDLVMHGTIGLMQALERFDTDKGFRFSTYATHWIRQAIGRATDNSQKS